MGVGVEGVRGVGGTDIVDDGIRKNDVCWQEAKEVIREWGGRGRDGAKEVKAGQGISTVGFTLFVDDGHVGLIVGQILIPASLTAR